MNKKNLATLPILSWKKLLNANINCGLWKTKLHFKPLPKLDNSYFSILDFLRFSRDRVTTFCCYFFNSNIIILSFGTENVFISLLIIIQPVCGGPSSWEITSFSHGNVKRIWIMSYLRSWKENNASGRSRLTKVAGDRQKPRNLICFLFIYRI